MEGYRILKKAQYENPKYSVDKPERIEDKNKRTLVIACTYVPENLNVAYNTRRFGDINYYRYVHNRIEALKFMMACYKNFKTGYKYDLIVIDNSSPYKHVEHEVISQGIKFIKRENTYYSFGAYKYAWDTFGKDYDYFLFHEFDWVPAKDYWLEDLIDYWNSDKEIGMIGNLIEQRGYNEETENDTKLLLNSIMRIVNKDRDFQYNLDSEYLFTDKMVINQMMEHGGWNIFPCEPETKMTPVINELGLQQPILEMGYKLACYNDGEHTMFYSVYNNGFCDKWNHGLDKLTPFIPEQTRLFVPSIRQYFNFYNHNENNSLVSWVDKLPS